MSGFLSEEEFNTLKSQQSTIIPWRDVPLDKIYYIRCVEKIQTSKGQATVVTLVDDIGEEQKAYATSILAEELESYQGGSYIKSIGKKMSEKNKGQCYYAYEIVNAGYDTVY